MHKSLKSLKVFKTCVDLEVFLKASSAPASETHTWMPGRVRCTKLGCTVKYATCQGPSRTSQNELYAVT